jgi:hypothetical protein
MTTTSKSKGKWYKPESSDKRNMGARKRNYKSKYSEESGKNTKRNVFKGYSDLFGLSNGIYEEKDTNYEEQENQLFEVNREIKKLITELETKKANDGKA